MRLIDVDELKKAIYKRSYYIDDYEEAIKVIDNAPTVEITEEQAIDKLHETGWLPLHDKEMTERPQGKWISVSERLPEESLNSVIGWDAYREKCVFVQYINGHFQITGNDESFNIVAWQPVPEPYKKDGAE